MKSASPRGGAKQPVARAVAQSGARAPAQPKEKPAAKSGLKLSPKKPAAQSSAATSAKSHMTPTHAQAHEEPGAAQHEAHQHGIWRRNLYTCWSLRCVVDTAFQFLVPFIPLMMRDMGVPASRIDVVSGIAVAIPGFFIGLAAPFWGHMSDRFGHKIIMLRALVSASILFFLFSLVNSAAVFIVLRMFQGLFTGVISGTLALVSASTPRAHQNRAMRFLVTSNLLTSTFVPAVSGSIMLYFGTTLSLRAGSVVILVWGIVSYLLMVDPVSKQMRAESRRRAQAHKAENKKIEYAPPRQKPVLLGCMAISALLNVTRVAPIVLALLAVLKFESPDRRAFVSGLVAGFLGLTTLIATYVISHISFRSKKSRFVSSAECLVALTLVSAAILLYRPVIGYWAYIAVFAVALGVSAGIDVVMQEVIGNISYTEHKGKVFGRLTLAGGMGRFFGSLALSAVSGSFGMTAVSVLMLVLLAATIAALLYVRRKELRT